MPQPPMKQMTVQLPANAYEVLRAAAFAVGSSSASVARSLITAGLVNMINDPDFRKRAEVARVQIPLDDIEKMVAGLRPSRERQEAENRVFDETFNYSSLENKRPPPGATGSVSATLASSESPGH